MAYWQSPQTYFDEPDARPKPCQTYAAFFAAFHRLRCALEIASRPAADRCRLGLWTLIVDPRPRALIACLIPSNSCSISRRALFSCLTASDSDICFLRLN